MTEYRSIYKCRLCGEEFASAVTGNSDIAIKHMVGVTVGYSPTEYIGAPITEKTMHSCKGGSMGMADFLGFRKVGGMIMPTKEFDRGKLFFGNGEVGFQPLGEQAEIELDENCKTLEGISFLNIGGQCEFTVGIQPPERMTFGDFILALHGFDVEKLKQNNWRKMHGMVMHRRKHG